MRLLLDTHILLWAVLDDNRLTKTQRDAITNGELYLSAASVWEIGLKRAIGKLDVPDKLFDIASDAGCKPLPISWVHAQAATGLAPHHADPFDRMLIAQARCERLSLVSSDKKFADYQVELIR